MNPAATGTTGSTHKIPYTPGYRCTGPSAFTVSSKLLVNLSKSLNKPASISRCPSYSARLRRLWHMSKIRHSSAGKLTVCCRHWNTI